MNDGRDIVKSRRGRVIITTMAAMFVAVSTAAAEEVMFAVVTNVDQEKRHVVAQIAGGGTVTEATLIPTDTVQDNPIWRSLEVCHSLKMQGAKTQDGYRISSVKMLDAGMLPMSLQGIAGDCLLKKALEFAPLVD